MVKVREIRIPFKMPELVYDDPIGDVEPDLDLHSIPDDVKEFAKVRLGETTEKRLEMLDELRELIYERGEFDPLRMDDDYLTRFLRARNYKLEPTYRLLSNYCNFREDNYEYYDGVNPMDLYNIGDANIVSVLPYRDQNGRRIMIYKLGKWIPSEIPLDDLFKASIATLEAGILEPRAQILGGVAIFDMADLSMTQAWYMTPTVIAKVQEIMATSFPMKISAIHIVNESWVFEKVHSMFKPFLTTRYKEILYFHGSDMESLHTHIHPEYLPVAYGGKRPEYHYAEWFRKLVKNKEVVDAMAELGYKTEYNEKHCGHDKKDDD